MKIWLLMSRSHRCEENTLSAFKDLMKDFGLIDSAVNKTFSFFVYYVRKGGCKLSKKLVEGIFPLRFHKTRISFRGWVGE